MEHEVDVKTNNEQNSKLLKGIVIGGMIGGCLALMDRNTRTAVTTKAGDLKDSSKNVLMHVKENPSEVKDQILDQVKQATDSLKHTIQEVRYLADRINEDVLKNAKEIKHEATEFAGDTKENLKELQSNVKATSSNIIESAEKTQNNEQTH